MKNKKYHTVEKQFQNPVKKLKKESKLTQIHDDSLSWLGTGASIKSYRVKLVLWAQTS